MRTRSLLYLHRKSANWVLDMVLLKHFGADVAQLIQPKIAPLAGTVPA